MGERFGGVNVSNPGADLSRVESPTPPLPGDQYEVGLVTSTCPWPAVKLSQDARKHKIIQKRSCVETNLT